MKKLLFNICVLCGLIFSFANVTYAYESVDVYVNGYKLITDQPAIIYQDRTMVPLRAITERLGCDVDWDIYTNTALISNPATIVAAQVDNYYLTKKDRGENNGKGRSIAIDVPPIIMNERTLVPARAISEALNAKVEWNGNYNRVDITLEYDYIADYNDAGYAKVIMWDTGETLNHMYGFIDKERNLVLPVQYENIGDFSDGLARIKDGNYWGYINEKLEFVVPLKYKSALDFSHGMATVLRIADDGIRDAWGYIDKSGNEIIKCTYANAGTFSDGLAFVQKFDSGKYSYIDTSGKVVIEGPFDFAWDFENGIARVKKNGKLGFINKNGESLTGFEFDNAHDFNDGLAPVYKMIDGKYHCGYVNEKGEVAIPLIYDTAWEFTEGLAPVLKDGKWGFVDTAGTVAIPIQYDSIVGWSPIRGGYSISGFQGGKALVTKDGEMFYIDKNGNMLN